MSAKASVSLLSEPAREAWEAEPVGRADRPHIHRPWSYIFHSARKPTL